MATTEKGAKKKAEEAAEKASENGKCTASDNPERDPKVTIKVGPVHFLKLAANKASGPTLFMTGKLKAKGDMGLAVNIPNLFEVPKA